MSHVVVDMVAVNVGVRVGALDRDACSPALGSETAAVRHAEEGQKFFPQLHLSGQYEACRGDRLCPAVEDDRGIQELVAEQRCAQPRGKRLPAGRRAADGGPILACLAGELQSCDRRHSFVDRNLQR